MKTGNEQQNPILEDDSLSWEDEEEERSQECVEHEKDTYIKHIRQDLFPNTRYCSVDKMAKAIGGEFTGVFVENICKEADKPIKISQRNGKKFVEIAPFLCHLREHLVFE